MSQQQMREFKWDTIFSSSKRRILHLKLNDAKNMLEFVLWESAII